MLTINRYEDLGHANHGWLDTRHHFSFAHYFDPTRLGYGALRVINDDVIKAGAGFDVHPHKDMEIITYVRKGAISHRDSQGNQGRTVAGDIQVMSAGTGIYHSEFNLESEDTNIFQIWIKPNQQGVTPSWETKAFPKEPVIDALALLVSGDGSAPLTIHQDAQIFGGRMRAGTTINHELTQQAYILASEGQISINGKKLKKGDGAEVADLVAIEITALSDAEVIVIEVPSNAANCLPISRS